MKLLLVLAVFLCATISPAQTDRRCCTGPKRQYLECGDRCYEEYSLAEACTYRTPSGDTILLERCREFFGETACARLIERNGTLYAQAQYGILTFEKALWEFPTDRCIPLYKKGPIRIEVCAKVVSWRPLDLWLQANVCYYYLISNRKYCCTLLKHHIYW